MPSNKVGAPSAGWHASVEHGLLKEATYENISGTFVVFLLTKFTVKECSELIQAYSRTCGTTSTAEVL
ncbi:MAG: hypothetical protein ACXV2C_07190 [Candidatus Bathyarchaeia archaeon]